MTARTGAEPDLLELTRTLISFPTPNPPCGERQLAGWLAAELESWGIEAQVLEVEGGTAGQANVFGRVRGTGGRPPLILSGHLDTVPSGEGAWSRDPYTAVVEDGRLYGLGASDMKAAVAAMTVAAAGAVRRSAAGQPLRGDVLLVFTSGEETRSLGARSFARSGLLDDAAGIVIGEPTANRVGIAEKGGIWLSVQMHGRTAHGSLPHLGANAIAGLAEAIWAIEQAMAGNDDAPGAIAGDAEVTRQGEATGTTTGDLARASRRLREVLLRPADPLLGVPTITATRLTGGVANNVVPDGASATFDVRTLPGQSGPDILHAVEGVATAVAAPRGLRVSMENHGERVALAMPVDHLLALACARAVSYVLETPAEFCALTGATDATELVPPLGLPFVICGPGKMAQAHQPDEYVSVAALHDSVRIYGKLIELMCG